MENQNRAAYLEFCVMCPKSQEIYNDSVIGKIGYFFVTFDGTLSELVKCEITGYDNKTQTFEVKCIEGIFSDDIELFDYDEVFFSEVDALEKINKLTVALNTMVKHYFSV